MQLSVSVCLSLSLFLLYNCSFAAVGVGEFVALVSNDLSLKESALFAVYLASSVIQWLHRNESN